MTSKTCTAQVVRNGNKYMFCFSESKIKGFCRLHVSRILMIKSNCVIYWRRDFTLLLQTRPPVHPTFRRSGSTSWRSVNSSIRTRRGEVTTVTVVNSCLLAGLMSGDLIQSNQFCYSPQISLRLLAHKIQSPQEWEALQALTVSYVSTPLPTPTLPPLVLRCT